MKALIAGGGIGGLAAALSLHQAGMEVRLFESARRFDALGVGINLQPHAMRELSDLGLGAEIAATGIPTAGLGYYNKHGQAIWSEPRGIAAGYCWPQVSIHRGELVMLLYRAAQARIGDASIRGGHHLTAFEQDADGITAHFTERHSGAPVTERGDILIGADGIHSAVRAHFYPDEGPPRFAGEMMWRAAIETERFLDGHTHVIIGHTSQKFLVYPMSGEAERSGRSLINWLAELGTEDTLPPRADWNKRVDKEIRRALRPMALPLARHPRAHCRDRRGLRIP